MSDHFLVLLNEVIEALYLHLGCMILDFFLAMKDVHLIQLILKIALSFAAVFTHCHNVLLQFSHFVFILIVDATFLLELLLNHLDMALQLVDCVVIFIYNSALFHQKAC